MSLRAFLLRISTFTLELLSIFIYGFLDFFFNALTFDFMVSTKFSNWIAMMIKMKNNDEYERRGLLGYLQIFHFFFVCRGCFCFALLCFLLHFCFALVFVLRFCSGFYWRWSIEMGLLLEIIMSLPLAVIVELLYCVL